MMTEFFFYQLSDQSAATAIAQLCERALANGWRLNIRAQSKDHTAISEALWSSNPASFLPHDIGSGHDSPICISDSAPDNAQCCFTYGTFDIFENANPPLERLCLMFTSQEEANIAHARRSWKEVGARGFAAKYYAQEGGAWRLKAENSVT